MFEIGDPAPRIGAGLPLGGIENHVSVDVAGQRIKDEPDPTRENTSLEGKASSVHFLRFRFTENELALFKTSRDRVIAGFDHPYYGHMAALPEPVRTALAEDFE